MHPSHVNCKRLREVKRISLFVLAALLLFVVEVTNGMFNPFFELLYAVIIGCLVGSWVFFLGTGKVWGEWFWKKRL
jgi:hypothetical protein